MNEPELYTRYRAPSGQIWKLVRRAKSLYFQIEYPTTLLMHRRVSLPRWTPELLQSLSRQDLARFLREGLWRELTSEEPPTPPHAV